MEYILCYVLLGNLYIDGAMLIYNLVQSFDAKFLKIYPELRLIPLQQEEDMEQLKVLENGYRMKRCFH